MCPNQPISPMTSRAAWWTESETSGHVNDLCSSTRASLHAENRRRINPQYSNEQQEGERVNARLARRSKGSRDGLALRH
jgi:hypothetical protein